MEAIILAGGLGTRLRDVVHTLPKPMAPIKEKPFLEYVIEYLKANGFTRIIISVGYMANKIEDYFGNTYKGIEIIYSRELSPLGTGGATKLAMEHCLGDHVYVFNGDTYLELEVAEVEGLWLRNRNPLIIGKMMLDASRYGRMNCIEGVVTSFLEKKEKGSGVINAGCYVLRRGELNSFPKLISFSIEKDYFEININARSIVLEAFISKGYFIDIGIPESYLAAKEHLS